MTSFSTLLDKPVFIVGHPRSGTTMLNSLLDGHPELLVFPLETFFFQHEWKSREELIDILTQRFRIYLKNKGEDVNKFLEYYKTYLKNENDPKSYFVALLETFYHHYSGSQNDKKKAFVEKTPGHIFALPLLKRYFPKNFKVLYIYRDPRAVYHSLKKLHDHKYFLETFCANYQSFELLSKIFQSCWGKKVWKRIGYEDLLNRPEEILNDICEHIKITFHPNLLKTTRNSELRSVPSSHVTHGTGISKDTINRYQEFLSDEEIASLEYLLSRSMKRNGYPFIASRTYPKLNIWIYYFTLLRNFTLFIVHLPPFSGTFGYIFFIRRFGSIKLKLKKLLLSEPR